MILSVLHHTAIKEIDYLIPDTRYCSASQTTGISNAGSRLPIFICLPKNKLIPTPKISTFPTSERFRMSVSLNNGERVPARMVMAP